MVCFPILSIGVTSTPAMQKAWSIWKLPFAIIFIIRDCANKSVLTLTTANSALLTKPVILITVNSLLTKLFLFPGRKSTLTLLVTEKSN